MYAIIASGGKQYKVAKNEIIKIEKLDAAAGSTVEFDKVLLLVDGEKVQVGTPFVKAKVTAEVLGEGRAEKVHIIKFRRRKHFMKRAGHRQYFSKVKIINIA